MNILNSFPPMRNSEDQPGSKKISFCFKGFFCIICIDVTGARHRHIDGPPRPFDFIVEIHTPKSHLPPHSIDGMTRRQRCREVDDAMMMKMTRWRW
ncbi:hypothetical protein HanIR_Chr10g0465491 [Helianthus annuus]|nr:hypothetical protein HanIR_Chr10g0465491 [Helianthus annuus]